MKYLLDKSSSYFDFFENHWNNKKTKSIIWFIIVISFILLGFAIEINKIFLSGKFNLPSDLFYSINFVFNLILFYEMIDLIFIMSKSFSIAISKQMEIYSLILVRDSFKLVSDVSDENIFLNYNEIFNLFNIFDILLKSDLFVMVSSIFGAVIVYILILKFKESYSRSVEINKNEDIDLFVLLKKAISLVHLFVVITFLIWVFFVTDVNSDRITNLISLFFLSLIYVDILHLLISYYFSKDFNLVFRNSSFSANTLLLRFSINTTPLLGIFIGIISSFLLVLTITYYNKNKIQTEN